MYSGMWLAAAPLPRPTRAGPQALTRQRRRQRSSDAGRGAGRDSAVRGAGGAWAGTALRERPWCARLPRPSHLAALRAPCAPRAHPGQLGGRRAGPGRPVRPRLARAPAGTPTCPAAPLAVNLSFSGEEEAGLQPGRPQGNRLLFALLWRLNQAILGLPEESTLQGQTSWPELGCWTIVRRRAGPCPGE